MNIIVNTKISHSTICWSNSWHPVHLCQWFGKDQMLFESHGISWEIIIHCIQSQALFAAILVWTSRKTLSMAPIQLKQQIRKSNCGSMRMKLFYEDLLWKIYILLLNKKKWKYSYSFYLKSQPNLTILYNNCPPFVYSSKLTHVV